MKIYAIVFLLLAGTLSVSAQIERKPAVVKADSANTVNPGNKANKESRKEKMKDLDLTKEQRIKMKEINQAGRAAKDDIDNNTSLTDQEKKKQLRKLQKDQAPKINAILTPEQREKFKTNRQNNS